MNQHAISRWIECAIHRNFFCRDGEFAHIDWTTCYILEENEDTGFVYERCPVTDFQGIHRLAKQNLYDKYFLDTGTVVTNTQESNCEVFDTSLTHNSL